MNQDKTFLGTEPVGKLLLKLSVPTVIAQLVNMLYNIVDRIYIGHMPGDGSLALTGVGVCLPIIMIVSAFAALISTGGAPRASIFMGKNDHESAEKTLGSCFTLQVLVSLVLTAVLLIWNRPLLLAFGASENTIDYATAYMNIYYASLSADENALQAIYDFLRVGFAIGSTVVEQYTNPHVMNLLELRRQVSNEAHHFREFARFQSLENQVYVSHLEPRNDVIMLVGNHFANRMPSEHWMIIDDNRKTACVHVKDGENYLRYLTDDEFSVLQKTESYEDEYTDMWKTFFHAISIEQRKNYVCQRNLFPIWKRKHAVEFR